MVNKEAAAVLVEYSAHIAHYAAIADVPEEQETVLTKAAGEHAWRLLAALLEFGEAAKESDLFWQLLHMANRDNKSDKECGRLRSIAKSEDFRFMKAKAELVDRLKGIRDREKADPTGKKRQAEADERERTRAENNARYEAERKEGARIRAKERRDAKKLAPAAVLATVAKKRLGDRAAA